MLSALVHLINYCGGRRNRLRRDKNSARLVCEFLEPRCCLSAFYDFQVVAQTGAATPFGFSSLGNGPSINDSGEVAFIGTSLNGGDDQGNNRQLADNVYAFNPGTGSLTGLMNRVFMYPKDGSENSVGGTQNFLPEVQINNNGDVLARRRLNALIQIGFPLGSKQTAPLSYLETWNSHSPNPPGLPSAQIAMGLPGAPSAPLWFFLNPVTGGSLPSGLNLQSPFDAMLLTSSINNLGQVSFTAIVRGSGNNRVSSNLRGDLIGRGPIGHLRLEVMLADNGQYVIKASDGRILVEPWALNAPFKELAGPGNGFSSLSKAGISDDGRVIAFSGSNAAGMTALYASVFDPVDGSYGPPQKVLGVSGDASLDHGEYLNENNIDSGGLRQFLTDSQVVVNRLSPNDDSHYSIAFLSHSDADATELNTVAIDVSEQTSVAGDAPVRVIGTNDSISTEVPDIRTISLHDAANNSGQLAFHVASTLSESIVSATPCGKRSVPAIKRNTHFAAVPACEPNDIQAISAFGRSETEITLRYSVASNSFDHPFNFRIYRSPTAAFHPKSASPITSIVSLPELDSNFVASYAPGFHEVRLQLPVGLIQDPAAPYFHLVVDPPHGPTDLNGAYDETLEDNNAVILPIIRLLNPANKELFEISTTPTMPNVRFRLEGVPVTATDIVTWRYTIETKVGECEHQIRPYVLGPIVEPIRGSSEFTPTFRSFMGGTFVVTASVELSRVRYEVTRDRMMIIGKNPTQQEITNYIQSNSVPAIYPVNAGFGYHDVLSRIMREESRSTQFLADGCPLFNTGNDGGAGLFQITPPDTQDVWNWRANVDSGIRIFKNKLSESRRYDARVIRASRKEIANLTNSLNLTRIDIPSWTDRMLLREAVQRYNGGRLHRLRRNPSGTLVVTIVDSVKRVGILEWEEDGNGYVAKVLGI